MNPFLVSITSQCKKAIEYETDQKNQTEAFFLYISCIEMFTHAQNSLSSQKPLVSEKEAKQLFSIATQCLARAQRIMDEIGSQLISDIKIEKVEQVPDSVNKIEQIQKRVKELEIANQSIKEKIKFCLAKDVFYHYSQVRNLL